MNRTACLLLAVLGSSVLSGCVTSLSDQAKLLAATQECGGATHIAQSPDLTKRHSHCVELQLEAIKRQEAAYERRQADVLVGLSKALERSTR
jgi:hypothetical protein